MSAAAAAATHGHSWKVATSVAKAQHWATPPAIYDALDREFNFTLDAAADVANAKHVKYFTLETDALRASWAGETVFCNPPYGRQMGRWIQKAYDEAAYHGATVVLLIPARTDVAWFHDLVLPHGEIRFIRGRLGFTLGGVAQRYARAPFASMVVIFRPGQRGVLPDGVQHVLPFLPRTVHP